MALSNKSYKRWPQPAGPWQLRTYFQEVDGRYECVGLELWGGKLLEVREGGEVRRNANGPWIEGRATPLTTELLRTVPLARLTQEQRDKTARRLRGLATERRYSWGEPIPEEVRTEAADVLARWEERGRRGARPRYGPEWFRNVAEVYRSAYSAGEAPTKAVQEQFHVSKSAAAKWVARARDLGFLPRTTRGRAGGRNRGEKGNL